MFVLLGVQDKSTGIWNTTGSQICNLPTQVKQASQFLNRKMRVAISFHSCGLCLVWSHICSSKWCPKEALPFFSIQIGIFGGPLRSITENTNPSVSPLGISLACSTCRGGSNWQGLFLAIVSGSLQMQYRRAFMIIHESKYSQIWGLSLSL